MNAHYAVPDSPRSIAAYERAYLASDFEPVQARMRKRMLLTLLERLMPRRILEVGCGSESLYTHWPNFDSFLVVEPGTGFAEKARRNAVGDTRIAIIEDFVETAAPKLAGEVFDLILVSGLLHEVPDPAAVLKGLHPLCGPDSVVHVNVPNARSVHRLLALEMDLIDNLQTMSDRQQALQQQRTFDMESLVSLCEQCGFKVNEQGSYFIKPFTHSQMSGLQSSGLLEERMLDGLYRLERHLPGLGSEIYVNLGRRE
jgi:SAM-dependent methyltransferase